MAGEATIFDKILDGSIPATFIHQVGHGNFLHMNFASIVGNINLYSLTITSTRMTSVWPSMTLHHRLDSSHDVLLR